MGISTVSDKDHHEYKYKKQNSQIHNLTGQLMKKNEDHLMFALNSQHYCKKPWTLWLSHFSDVMFPISAFSVEAFHHNNKNNFLSGGDGNPI